MGSTSTAPSASDAPARAPRKDAARNRDALLVAAGEVFGERGADASLEEVARRAGVGIGTLYRHFPTRDVLSEAVYRREVDALCDLVGPLRAEHPPVEALAAWMRAFAGYVPRKRGMAVALKAALGPENELFAYSHQRLSHALNSLVGEAAATGEIRGDVDPMDLMRAMGGICMATDSPGWSETAGRLVNLLVDGLRFGAPGRAG